MIFSSVYAKDDVGKYPEAIQKAISYLKDNDFIHMEPGVCIKMSLLVKVRFSNIDF